MTQFIAIVAYDTSYGIAKNDTIPWNVPPDKWFYRQLIADAVIIRSSRVYNGRNFSAPPRKQIVMSRRPVSESSHTIVRSEEEALQELRQHKLVYNCGGQDIYQMFADITTSVIATEINANYDCDRFFPSFHLAWPSQVIADIPATEHAPSATIKVYNR